MKDQVQTSNFMQMGENSTSNVPNPEKKSVNQLHASISIIGYLITFRITDRGTTYQDAW